MKNHSNISVAEFEESVHQILECQENILKLESISADIQSAMIKKLLEEINAIERMIRC